MKNEWIKNDMDKVLDEIMDDITDRLAEDIGPRMTKEDIEVLEQQNMHTLAKWWCEFNSWGWPCTIPNPETKDERFAIYEDNKATGERKKSRAMQIMDWIDNRIGHRVISQEWNKDRMSPEEFNDFWMEIYEGNKEARERNKKRNSIAFENHTEKERRRKMKEAVDLLGMYVNCQETAELIKERLSWDD